MATEGTSGARGIVVGVDGSEGSTHALRWAVAEAAIRRVPLRVVQAWAPPVPMARFGGDDLSVFDPEPYRQLATERVHEQVAEVADTARRANVDVEAVAVGGYPPDVLVAEAEAASMLVVGSRGRGGFRGLLLGSVSQRAVATSMVPVAVVPSMAGLPDASDVVVGVDGSECSRRALQVAVEEAARRKARLSVVHTWWTPYAVPPEGLAIAPADEKRFLEASERMLHEMTEQALAQTELRPDIVELLPIEEPAARGLIERSLGAGLLVIGGRGRNALTGLLLGSVSQQCLHHAKCAVLVVPDRRQTP